MRSAVVVALVCCCALGACAQLGALFGVKSTQTGQPEAAQQQQPRAGQSQQEAERQQAAQREQARVEAEQRAQARAVELDRLRGELSAGTGDPEAAALAFAAQVRDVEGELAATLAVEAAGYVDAAMRQAPSFELLRALGELPRAPEVDDAFVRACPRLRPRVEPTDVVSFTGECLERAGGDAARLSWPNFKKDLVAYRRAQEEALRRAHEEEARRAKEEEARAKEEVAKAARAESYVGASVFAAGRCNFGDCGKDGWTIATPDGDVRVRCNFGNCLKDGWVAEFPDNTRARTACHFGDCFKDGWRTELPNGQGATTRCRFNNCPQDGWSTEIPGLGTAETRCNFQDCLKDGWTTALPTGRQVRCRCNFQDCRTNGAACD